MNDGERASKGRGRKIITVRPILSAVKQLKGNNNVRRGVARFVSFMLVRHDDCGLVISIFLLRMSFETFVT